MMGYHEECEGCDDFSRGQDVERQRIIQILELSYLPGEMLIFLKKEIEKRGPT
jgi:hypothetical protein